MKVAYVFATPGRNAHYKIGQMILPQLEEDRHGAEVVGMFFFDDNNYVLRSGDPIERLSRFARERAMLLTMCDRCAVERGLATGDPDSGEVEVSGVVDGVTVGCFPEDLLSWVEVNDITVVLVTHDLEEAITLSDRVHLMSAGPHANIVDSYDVPLPRPRDLVTTRTDPAFGLLLERLWGGLAEVVDEAAGDTETRDNAEVAA